MDGRREKKSKKTGEMQPPQEHAKDEERADAALTSGTLQRWKNVGGKKVTILAEPDVSVDVSGKYVEQDEVFRVEEVLPAAKKDFPHGHVYLRLANGLGWVSSRSGKDLDKVVATPIPDSMPGVAFLDAPTLGPQADP